MSFDSQIERRASHQDEDHALVKRPIKFKKTSLVNKFKGMTRKLEVGHESMGGYDRAKYEVNNSKRRKESRQKAINKYK